MGKFSVMKKLYVVILHNYSYDSGVPETAIKPCGMLDIYNSKKG